MHFKLFAATALVVVVVVDIIRTVAVAVAAEGFDFCPSVAL